jgi:hypothetical protein
MGNSEPEDPVGSIDATRQDVEHLRGVYCVSVTLQRAHSSSYALAAGAGAGAALGSSSIHDS